MKLILFLFSMFIASCVNEQPANVVKLGNIPFSVNSWSVATQEKRGEMVNSFLKSYKVEGMEVSELKKLLGESTAYYEYDEFPAYIIGPRSIDSIYSKGYVLAFPINRSTGKIRKYVIDPEIR